MSKQLCDVEDLLVWAAAELSRKRSANVLTMPPLGVNARDRECVGKWTWPMGFPPISPMFAAGVGQKGVARGDPPHADADIVEDAIDRLRLVAPDLEMEPRELAFGLGFEVDAAGAIAAARANAANLVLVHAKLGSRPSLRFEPLEPSAKPAPNGKPGVWRREQWAEPTFDDHAETSRLVEVAVTSLKRKDLYPSGSYGRLEWSPDPQEIVNERAEYAAWRASLARLAEELEGKLESRGVLAPGAARAPWLGDRDGGAVYDRLPAEGAYAPEQAASLQAERAVYGGAVYRGKPVKPAKGAKEA